LELLKPRVFPPLNRPKATAPLARCPGPVFPPAKFSPFSAQYKSCAKLREDFLWLSGAQEAQVPAVLAAPSLPNRPNCRLLPVNATTVFPRLCQSVRVYPALSRYRAKLWQDN